VDNTQKPITTISLCTGLRGLDRGIERAVGPVRALAYVEIEAFIIENLLAGMETGMVDPAPIWANLRTFDGLPFYRKVDILMGGYPCQPFSTAGLRQGEDDPRHLYPFIERIIGTVRPVCCFFENVAGHLSLGFDKVAESLRGLGYNVEAGLYTAAEIGAPHKRARLFILAILADAGCPSWWENHPSRGRPFEDYLYGDRAESADRSECAGEELGNSPGDDQCGTGQSGSTGCQPAGRSGANVADSESNGIRREGRDVCEADGGSIGGVQQQPISTGEKELADPNGHGAGSGPGDPFGQGQKDETTQYGKGWDYLQWQRGRAIAGDGGTNVDNADDRQQPADAIPTGGATIDVSSAGGGGKFRGGVGLADSSNQRLQGNEQGRLRGEGGGVYGSVTERGQEGTIDFWPARPGEPQRRWEAQRTVESSVGFTIDGYNFTEDLLRAAGNGVVEQTAEKAFIELMNKHFPCPK
jgi:site-specific DNA-cytosine methylase